MEKLEKDMEALRADVKVDMNTSFKRMMERMLTALQKALPQRIPKVVDDWVLVLPNAGVNTGPVTEALPTADVPIGPLPIGGETTVFMTTGRLELPSFDGQDLRAWIAWTDQFFMVYPTPVAQRVEQALIVMTSDALYWLQWMLHRMPSLTWAQFTWELLLRFGDNKSANNFEALEFNSTGWHSGDADEDDVVDDSIESINEGVTQTVVEKMALQFLGLSPLSSHGFNGSRTMKLIGRIADYKLLTMIDTQWLQLDINISQCFAVTLGNGEQVRAQGLCRGVQLYLQSHSFAADCYVFLLGGVDIILGVNWLSELGNVTTNWLHMSMEFVIDSQKIRLLRDPSLTRRKISMARLDTIIDVNKSWLLWSSDQLVLSELRRATNGKGRPIAYFSKALADRNLVKFAYEKELMAMVLAIQNWRPYLVGRRFLVRTDQRSLRHLLQQPLTTLAQQNWVGKLMGYNSEIVYKMEALNCRADLNVLVA
ncbi:hypothetical protein C2S52_021300 [Perilla frutescens var. hirtella]|nr:hypothetical protein C2S52_021300 [Perilla frutescens var. hirtella]